MIESFDLKNPSTGLPPAVENKKKFFESTFQAVENRLSKFLCAIDLWISLANAPHYSQEYKTFLIAQKEKTLNANKKLIQLKKHIDILEKNTNYAAANKKDVSDFLEILSLSHECLLLFSETFDEDSIGLEDLDEYEIKLQQLYLKIVGLPGNSNDLLIDISTILWDVASALISLGFYFLLYCTISHGALFAGTALTIIALVILGITSYLEASSQRTELVGIFYTLIESLQPDLEQEQKTTFIDMATLSYNRPKRLGSSKEQSLDFLNYSDDNSDRSSPLVIYSSVHKPNRKVDGINPLRTNILTDRFNVDTGSTGSRSLNLSPYQSLDAVSDANLDADSLPSGISSENETKNDYVFVNLLPLFNQHAAKPRRPHHSARNANADHSPSITSDTAHESGGMVATVENPFHRPHNTHTTARVNADASSTGSGSLESLTISAYNSSDEIQDANSDNDSLPSSTHTEKKKKDDYVFVDPLTLFGKSSRNSSPNTTKELQSSADAPADAPKNTCVSS